MKHQAQALCSASLLAGSLIIGGCGGGDIGQPIVDTYVCALTGCIDSETVPTSDISPVYTVTQDQGRVNVSAYFTQRGNGFKQLEIHGKDQLFAAVDQQAVPLRSRDDQRMRWNGEIANPRVSPSAKLTLQRGSESFDSTVELPALAFLSGANAPTLKPGNSHSLQLNVSAQRELTTRLEGDCQRSDNSRFSVKSDVTSLQYRWLGTVNGGASLLVPGSDLAVTLADASTRANSGVPTAAVSSCSLTALWIQTRYGQLHPALHKDGAVMGQSVLRQTLAFSAS